MRAGVSFRLGNDLMRPLATDAGQSGNLRKCQILRAQLQDAQPLFRITLLLAAPLPVYKIFCFHTQNYISNIALCQQGIYVIKLPIDIYNRLM